MSIVPIPGKQIASDIGKGGRWLFSLIERLRKITTDQDNQSTLIENQAEQIQAQAAEIAELRLAVRALQLREDVLLAKAETAAAQAAAATVMDLARRIGRIEGGGKPE